MLAAIIHARPRKKWSSEILGLSFTAPAQESSRSRQRKNLRKPTQELSRTRAEKLPVRGRCLFQPTGAMAMARLFAQTVENRFPRCAATKAARLWQQWNWPRSRHRNGMHAQYAQWRNTSSVPAPMYASKTDEEKTGNISSTRVCG